MQATTMRVENPLLEFVHQVVDKLSGHTRKMVLAVVALIIAVPMTIGALNTATVDGVTGDSLAIFTTGITEPFTDTGVLAIVAVDNATETVVAVAFAEDTAIHAVMSTGLTFIVLAAPLAFVVLAFRRRRELMDYLRTIAHGRDPNDHQFKGPDQRLMQTADVVTG